MPNSEPIPSGQLYNVSSTNQKSVVSTAADAMAAGTKFSVGDETATTSELTDRQKRYVIDMSYLLKEWLVYSTVDVALVNWR
jgi:hypothetical protein